VILKKNLILHENGTKMRRRVC